MVAADPVERMVQVLMQCGKVHDAHSFSVNAIEQIRTLIPFDQGRVYFFNDNARSTMNSRWASIRGSPAFTMNTANVEDGLYNAAKRAWNFLYGKYPPVHDWSS